MTRNTKIVKKIVALFLVLLLSIDSLAAVVSDNDGSAFITKAEFDSLKNDFQSQIDQYNTNIDSKIDNAIALYFAGLTVSQAPIVLIDNINAALGGTCWFKNSFPGVGLATITPELNWSLKRDYVYREWSGITWSPKIQYSSSQIIAGTQLCWSSDTVATRICFKESAYPLSNKSNFTSLQIGEDWSSWWGATQGAYTTMVPISNSISGNSAGSGSVWISEMKPSGLRILKEYCTSIYPRQTVNFHVKSWGNKSGTYNKSRFDAFYVNAGGLGWTTVLPTINIPQLNTWSVKMMGDAPDTIGYKQWYELRQDLAKKNDGQDYSIYMWGSNANTNLYWIDSRISPEVSSSPTSKGANDSKSTFYALRYPATGPELSLNTLSGQAFSYYPISISTTRNNAYNFANIYLSNYFNENIYIDNGIPIINTLQDNQRIKIKIKFKTSSGSGRVHFSISDQKFNNNTFSSSATIRVSDVIDAGVEKTIEIDTNNKGYIWLTCYAEANDVNAAVDTLAALLET